MQKSVIKIQNLFKRFKVNKLENTFNLQFNKDNLYKLIGVSLDVTSKYIIYYYKINNNAKIIIKVRNIKANRATLYLFMEISLNNIENFKNEENYSNDHISKRIYLIKSKIKLL